LVVLVLVLATAQTTGPYLNGLYAIWSPLHYAAQTYGLGMLYFHRAELSLSKVEKRFFYLACLLPFFFALFSAVNPKDGLGWFLTSSLSGYPWQAYFWKAIEAITTTLRISVYIVPIVFFWRVRKKASTSHIPMIIPLLVLSNALAWTVLQFWGALAIITTVHALQYLALVIPHHLKDQSRTRKNFRPWVEGFRFYFLSLVAGYALFGCLPYAFETYGFGFAESSILVGATINIHHFIIDAFIWRSRNQQRGRLASFIPIGYA
jgi:hypothetical protein